jgi:hypothetical protein
MGAATPASTVKEIGRNGLFVAYDDGTVLDTRTNLMWAARDNGAGINWKNAKSYCENSRGGGYSDWRMPTQDELAGLRDSTIKDDNSSAGSKMGVTNLIRLTNLVFWASDTRGSEVGAFILIESKRYWASPAKASNNVIRALPVRSAK